MIARTGRLPSYLTTYGCSYCFRMRVLHELKSSIGRRQMKFSLRTDCVQKARSNLKGKYFVALFNQIVKVLLGCSPVATRIQWVVPRAWGQR
jgi:hypothetical protein